MRSLRRKKRVTLRRLLFFAGIPLLSLGITFATLHAFVKVRELPISITAPVAKTAKTQIVKKAPPPQRLTIEGIGVDTPVKQVELTATGDMAIDDSIDSVAWYRLGPEPGEQGSAVIAGHYGWKNGQAAVFNNLHTLKVGDQVVVSDEDGAKTTFAVRELREFNPDADAAEVFRSSDGRAHLNLVTCIGTWNRSAQSYTKRLVVFTDEVNP